MNIVLFSTLGRVSLAAATVVLIVATIVAVRRGSGGLGALPGVREVEPRTGDDGRARVTVLAAGGEDLRPRIFDLAKRAGWTLYELHQEAGSLEDLFRELTTDQEPA